MAVLQLVVERTDLPADSRGQVAALPNPDRQPPEAFEGRPAVVPWYPATDGLIEVGLRVGSFGIRVVRVALREESGAPSSDRTHELEAALAEALRRGDRGAVEAMLSDEIAELILQGLQLAVIQTGLRASLSRYGTVELHGPASEEQAGFETRLLEIAERIFADE